MTPVEVTPRKGPLVLSMPHGGTELPGGLYERLTPEGRKLHDTDWWIERLYDFPSECDATVVRALGSRYVIDVNRDPSDRSLYPGQATTGLCPTVTFDGEPLYAPGDEPDADEIAERRREWFEPYHAALAEQLDRVRQRHGFALLYDCHSIRSLVPRLFDGELPVLNVGTNEGKSCAPGMQDAVIDACRAQTRYSYIVNGRFRGGWITRRYGRPEEGVHAVQMELAQRVYMEETPPYAFDDSGAESIRPVLRSVLDNILDWASHNLSGG